jgi:hypothetical protein
MLASLEVISNVASNPKKKYATTVANYRTVEDGPNLPKRGGALRMTIRNLPPIKSST